MNSGSQSPAASRSTELFVADCDAPVSFFGPNRFNAEFPDGRMLELWGRLERRGKECAMPYCITLRSRTDKRITGWYAGGSCRWSTDHKRQKRFENKRDAGAVCEELRDLCPRNAKVINIEVTEGGPNLVGCSRPEQVESSRAAVPGASVAPRTEVAITSSPLPPAVAWTAVLLGSLGLWWGIWSAASALISAPS